MELWMQVALVAAINFSSALLQASTGFGYAMVAMALMPLFLPMSTCSAISAVTVVAIGLQMSLKLRKHLRIKTIVTPLIGCMLTINAGLILLETCNELTLRIILASLLVLVTGLFFFMRVRKISLPDKWYVGLIAGMITGLSTGMFNIVGPFLLVYYMNVCDDTLHMKASLEFSFLLSGIYSTLMHLFVYHNITWSNSPHIAGSVAAAMVAGVIGLKLYRKCNKDKIALFIYILLPIMAALLVWNGLK